MRTLRNLILGITIGVSLAWVTTCTAAIVRPIAERRFWVTRDMPELILWGLGSLVGWAVLIMSIRRLKQMSRTEEGPGPSFEVLPPK